MSESSPLARHIGRGEGSRLSLPTFEPLRPRSNERGSRDSSSHAGSRRSGSGDGSHDRSHVRDSLSFSNSLHDSSEKPVNGQSSHRNSPRSSGGFLLDSVAQSSRLSRSLHLRSQKDPKGKRKSEESELSIPKRRLRNSSAKISSAVGSSPLAIEVKPEAITHHERGNGSAEPGTDVRHSNLSSTGSSSGQHLEIERPSVPSVGYDTDPAQIVNMALSLSEARRRQASEKRYVSTDHASARVVSSATTGSFRRNGTNPSIAQYMTPHRQSSHGDSPKPKPSSPRSKLDFLEKDQTENAGGEENADDEDEVMMDGELSRPTQARVQKAKTFFELAYEHRRLLSHLPPIRTPGAPSRSEEPDCQSKAYNPLQYIRNRKLRVWDKTAIDAEADGWYDVKKVREWVDAVTQADSETQHAPDECVRLPPLVAPAEKIEESEPDATKPNPTSRMRDQRQTKSRRPRLDWATHPGDMIADCFWLEQGMNKIKIQDRENNQIYPPHTHFKFSGWRRRTPVDVPTMFQEPTPPPESEESRDEPLHSPLPELPTFRSANKISGRGRGRKRNSFKDSLAVDEGSTRRKGLRLFMDDSETDSSSSAASSKGNGQRGRKRISTKRQKTKPRSDGSPATDQLTSAQTRESASSYPLSPSDFSQPSSAQQSKRPSVDHPFFGKFLSREKSKNQTPADQSPARVESSRRGSKDLPIFEFDRPRNSADYDSTAPNSPVGSQWPSIAISLDSPPQSRSSSPTKKTKHSMLSPFREIGLHGKHDRVSATDFANISNDSSRNPSGEVEKKDDSSTQGSRGTSPMTRGTSPFSKSRNLSVQSEAVHTEADHRLSTVSRVSTKTNGSTDHSRIRGIFKGGRIAELVGHEVSRVGDFIWKRDLPPTYKHRGSISDGSIRSFNSDSDEESHPNGNIHKTPPQQHLRSRSSTISTKSENSPTYTRTSPNSAERPKYNNPNLPSFTSPFQQDKDRQEKIQGLLTPTNSPPGDHISRMAAEHRSVSRSPRLDRLAPPKLNTHPGSPDGLSKVNSYGFPGSLDISKSRDASDIFNSAISGNQSPNVGVLKGSRSAVELSRNFNLSNADLNQEISGTTVTKREITRAEALLYSSAVKAREIARRADAPRPKIPRYLLQTLHPNNPVLNTLDLSQVRRREEHIIAARNIMSTLLHQATEFNAKLREFTEKEAPSLHMELQTLEDMVDNQMTPRVRVSADEAGELSMQLNTTSTLAVKGLNDAIESAMRMRRRGPVRWVRRLWYASIEWTVVGLLWGIWAVVTLLRFVRAVVGFVVRTGRWLLWMD